MIVAFTALQEEYRALRKHLTDARLHRHPAGTLFEKGLVAGRPVAIAVIGDGNASAAALTERAIAEFRPRAVLFVGIAGALHSWLRLGDVVVATKVYGYHGGHSTDDGLRNRPQAWSSSHELEQVARMTALSDEWYGAGKPHVHFNPIAAGEVVLDSKTSQLAIHLRNHYDDAIAIEMESAGMATAGHLSRTPTLTIRGISDFADGAKDRTGQPVLAAENAAAFTVAVISTLPTEGNRPQERPDRAPGHTVNNTVSGTARVVAQIGIVHGNVRINSSDDSAPTADELGAAVVAESRAGRLDPTAVAEATQALDELRNTSDPARRKVITHRLAELLGRLPHLATLVARLTADGA